jgi:hypothetical protein
MDMDEWIDGLMDEWMNACGAALRCAVDVQCRVSIERDVMWV